MRSKLDIERSKICLHPAAKQISAETLFSLPIGVIMGWVMKMDNEKELPKRKPTRLRNFDYSSAGAYFVTICIKDRKRILSDIIKPVGVGAFDDPLTPQIQLTEIGKITEKYLLSSENIPGVKIDRYVVMPDHIHVIIFLYPDEYASRKDGSSRAPTPTNEMLPHIVSTFKVSPLPPFQKLLKKTY